MLEVVSTIADCLRQSAKKLDSDNPRLDVEVLLAHVLRCDRSYFYTWPEKNLTTEQKKAFAQLLERRQRGEPIAYLTGEREFWSLRLHVSADTLIPRPETELLVELSLDLVPADSARVLDLGTGTGAIALALATEKKDWQVLAVDNNDGAVKLALKNVERCSLDNVTVVSSHWFSAVSAEEHFDLIVSNPPYVDGDDPHLSMGDVAFEPKQALVADDQGLADLQTIIAQAKSFLRPGGYLLLEHGATQGAAVRECFDRHDYVEIATHRDLAELERVTLGRLGKL